MKKILYSASLLLAAATIGCEEADNGSSCDTTPAVTIYKLETPVKNDPDIDCKLRIVPNTVTQAVYILPELQKDKQAFIAAEGADAYVDRVIETGTRHEAETLEPLFEGLKGDYSITIVAEGSGQRIPFEYVFNGIVWLPAGSSLALTNLIGYLADENDPDSFQPYTAEIALYRKSNGNEFFVQNFFEQISGGDYKQEQDQRLYFSFDKNKKLTGFTPEGGKYIYTGDYPYVGYWDPSSYGSYCTLKQPSEQEPFYSISTLLADLSTGSLYLGQQILLTMDKAIWHSAE